MDKAKLRACRAMRYRIRNLEMRITEADKLIHSASAIQMQIGQGSGSAYDSIGRSVVRLIAMREVYALELDAYTQHRADAEAAIRKVGDPQLREILCLRYIDALSWVKIALRMSNSERNCYELHRKALEEMQFMQ